MTRYSFNDSPVPTENRAENFTHLWQMVVRGFGFVLMLVGLWIALAVMLEAWSLYRTPAGIERMAKAIERGSNLDQSLARASRNASAPDEAANPTATASQAADTDSVLGFRLSYFVAWIIVILLLMLIGRLAIAAVKTGGELVLFDRHVQQLAREIVRENAKTRA